VKQSKYLFLGGPLDQQWRAVPRMDALVVAVECATGPTTARMVHYHRQWMIAPGWLVPIAVFSADPTAMPMVGTPLPGWIQGEIPQRTPLGPLNWTGPTRPLNRLHAATKASGCRP
jgi:hypothetical protein